MADRVGIGQLAEIGLAALPGRLGRTGQLVPVLLVAGLDGLNAAALFAGMGRLTGDRPKALFEVPVVRFDGLAALGMGSIR